MKINLNKGAWMEAILDADAAIVARKTTKVLSEASLAEPSGWARAAAELLEIAGMAPFHRACDSIHREGALSGIEPWRFHVLGPGQCRQLADWVPPENAGKIPSMLRAADMLFLTTWLPNPDSQAEVPEPAQDKFEPTLGNMEHIAAAAAAIQNLLIAATARGIPSYWSSGGVLRTQAVFEKLQIPSQQILLGAVFLFPQQADATIVGSKLRSHRTPRNQWSRLVE